MPSIVNLPDVNHKNKKRHINILSNLEWSNDLLNRRHAVRESQKLTNHRILQLDKDTGKVVGKFYSYRQAASAIGSPNLFSNISRVCRCKKNYVNAGGYKWIHKPFDSSIDEGIETDDEFYDE